MGNLDALIMHLATNLTLSDVLNVTQFHNLIAHQKQQHTKIISQEAYIAHRAREIISLTLSPFQTLQSLSATLSGIMGVFPFIDSAPSLYSALANFTGFLVSFDVDATNCAVHTKAK